MTNTITSLRLYYDRIEDVVGYTSSCVQPPVISRAVL